MLTNLRLEITVWHRPLWGLGFVRRCESWDLIPAETMTDEDVYEMAQKFVKAGAEVNVVERKSCVSAT